MSFRPRIRSLVGLAGVLALLLCVLTLAPKPASAHTTHAARPLSPPPVHFIVTATSANDDGFDVFINNPATNNNPNLALFVTPNFDPGGACGCLYDSSPLVPLYVFYNGSLNQWEIQHLDGVFIPLRSTFNVLAVPLGGSVFVQTATSSNSSDDSTYIDNPLTNGNPGALLLIATTVNSHNVGVWYDTSRQKWAIFNEDRTQMGLGPSFFVMVGSGVSGGGREFSWTATTSNTGGDSTYLDTSVTNRDPNAMVFVTQNWNPGAACGCLYDTATLGVWYLGRTLFVSPLAHKWAVFNEDKSTIPIGAGFNVLAFSS